MKNGLGNLKLNYTLLWLNQFHFHHHLCNQAIKPGPALRLHIAAHIVQQASSSGELMLDICGFCGRLPPCKTSLEFNRKKTVNIKIDCPQFIEFSYGAAAKDASSGSCNVPIMCPLCNISVFKFSLPNHYSIIHKGKEMPSDYKLERETYACTSY